ncbi:citrate lyase beta subunit [Roseimicrobium gellanilyticum]|uniref:Citrate lyase beta subunit n=2 Tax=Roseimicrobium gellanilyticum TaxID=748857 RepID=A0A366HN69_9BACT|nr:citrate lyase beta subunit [Roseimicrobium gellanilyticum]
MTPSASFHLAPVLYVPASRPDLQAILSGRKKLGVCSLAVCLEDAVRIDDRARAASRLCEILHQASSLPHTIFVRPADSEMLERLLDAAQLDHIAAFVLPKATTRNIARWMELTCGRFPILPILESNEALDHGGRRELAAVCAEYSQFIPRVRIGANDLFARLGGLRRPQGCTVYETPLGRVIDELLEVFVPRDIPLSGPVFDRLDDLKTLEREVELDIHRGLFCKTALNPAQVATIWSGYKPGELEIEEANHILHPDSPAVFGMNGSMHEPACHGEWARRLLTRQSMHRAAELALERRAQANGNGSGHSIPGLEEAGYPIHKASTVS